MEKINVIGAGLAGVEAVYYLINKGYTVDLYEKRPLKNNSTSCCIIMYLLIY